METQELDLMTNAGSSIRVSPELRRRLDRTKANIFLNTDKKLSMEQLIELLLDVYESKEGKEGRKTTKRRETGITAAENSRMEGE